MLIFMLIKWSKRLKIKITFLISILDFLVQILTPMNIFSSSWFAYMLFNFNSENLVLGQDSIS